MVDIVEVEEWPPFDILKIQISSTAVLEYTSFQRFRISQMDLPADRAKV